MTYYKIKSTYYDTGKIIKERSIIESDTIPEATEIRMRMCDVYEDYFERKEDADEFYNEEV